MRFADIPSSVALEAVSSSSQDSMMRFESSSVYAYARVTNIIGVLERLLLLIAKIGRQGLDARLRKSL